MIGIYKITNPNGKIYIGQAKDLSLRLKQYLKLQNCKGQTKLYNSFMFYGVENHVFEIIEECDREELNNKERYYQDLYNVIEKNGLNCKLQKSDDKIIKHSLETRLKISKSNLGKKHTQESKIKMSLSTSGENHHMYGKNLTREIKDKISKSHIGIVPNEETRLKMSESAKNRPKRTYSEEHKLKISIGNKGKKRTKEQLIKISKKVIDTETNIIYDSVKEAADFFNINRSTLTQYLCGFRTNKTTLKYV